MCPVQPESKNRIYILSGMPGKDKEMVDEAASPLLLGM